MMIGICDTYRVTVLGLDVHVRSADGCIVVEIDRDPDLPSGLLPLVVVKNNVSPLQLHLNPNLAQRQAVRSVERQLGEIETTARLRGNHEQSRG